MAEDDAAGTTYAEIVIAPQIHIPEEEPEQVSSYYFIYNAILLHLEYFTTIPRMSY